MSDPVQQSVGKRVPLIGYFQARPRHGQVR